MEVTLASNHMIFVHGQVKDGCFSTPEAVVAEALRRMEEDENRALRLREEIEVGMNAANRGDFVPLDVEDIIGEILAENP